MPGRAALHRRQRRGVHEMRRGLGGGGSHGHVSAVAAIFCLQLLPSASLAVFFCADVGCFSGVFLASPDSVFFPRFFLGVASFVFLSF